MSCWQELGIAPTIDRADIRRAYASRLKSIYRDPDTLAFQRLRAAYEQALREAEGGAGPPRNGSIQVLQKTAPDRAAEQARAEVAAVLARGDATAAYSVWEAAERRGLLALADLAGFEEQLLAVVVADHVLTAGAFARIVARFQWDASVHPLRRRQPEAFRRLDDRLDAERWYDDLVERSRTWRGLFESDDRLAARQILSGPPSWSERHFLANRSPALYGDLAAVARHQEWIGDRFDQQRLAWCRGPKVPKANRNGQRVVVWIWVGMILFSLLGNVTRPGGLAVFLPVVVLILIGLVNALRRSHSRRKR